MKIKTADARVQKISEKDVIKYVTERFQEIKKKGKIKDLILFQAMNKYMIMAHSQEELKKLGNIVASNKKREFTKILEEYEDSLEKALKNEPTVKKHSNVIMHIFGYFSKNFNQTEKENFFKLLEKYKIEKTPIGEILAEINPIIYRFDNTYLASQTYFLLYANTQPGNLFKLLENNS